MPEIDGLEPTLQIRGDRKTHSIPIIALTALVMLEDLEWCLEAGANNYLAKPVKINASALIL